ncbi:hypothetical protein SJAV_02310 [Sulfurisphaera javensis]|uniref:Rod shape-determining protein MreD n=1 Tax=Sulfurisphaera javensis TaxID=2049879 RepID=A0AAT9GN43_9CREN
MKFLLASSLLLSLLSLFIYPQYTILPLIPLLLYLSEIKVKSFITATLLILSIPLDNPIVYGTVLEIALISW